MHDKHTDILWVELIVERIYLALPTWNGNMEREGKERLDRYFLVSLFATRQLVNLLYFNFKIALRWKVLLQLLPRHMLVGGWVDVSGWMGGAGIQ